METYKIYNLMISRVFPATHPRAGESTEFPQKLINASLNLSCMQKKLHTIRANFDLWTKRIEEIQQGHALLRVRKWEGLPYRSPTKVIKQFSWGDGVGIQKLELNSLDFAFDKPLIDGVECTNIDLMTLAKNDGLTFTDWKNWFASYDLSKPLAIIHFTPFRYLPIDVHKK